MNLIKDKIVVKNQLGIHMRPAAVLSKIASKLNSNIRIKYNGQIINPKSILNLINAKIGESAEIEIICVGETEKEDLQILLDAISAGLGE